jgi:integrase
MQKDSRKKRKRGQGEGSIYKRKDGRWAAAINLGYHSGKLKRKTVYGKSRAEVRDKLTAAMNDVRKGIPLPNERITLAQFLQTWLADVAKPSIRPKTYRTYSDIVRHHIEPTLGRKSLAKLSPHDVQKLLNDKLQVGLSALTVQHITAVLRTALNVAVKWGLIYRNVATLVSPPRVQQQEMKVFTPEQAKVFLDSVKGHRLEALFIMALTSGLRRGELLGLHWSDVDLDAATLRVKYALSHLDGEVNLAEPKTEKSRRLLSLPSLLITALRAHRSRQLEERLRAGEHWQQNDFVFTSLLGEPIMPRNLNRAFDTLVKNAGLPKIRLHDCRHTAATILLSQGVSPRLIMELLGHSRVSLTMNTYAHILPEMTREAASVMDAVLGGK